MVRPTVGQGLGSPPRNDIWVVSFVEIPLARSPTSLPGQGRLDTAGEALNCSLQDFNLTTMLPELLQPRASR